jgi:hypothetical protein
VADCRHTFGDVINQQKHKAMTRKQIKTIQSLTWMTSTNFRSNRKQYNGVPVEIVKEIVQKKTRRALAKEGIQQTRFQKVKRLIAQSLDAKGTNYFKVMIEGNTGIYYAHPEFGHADYNKSRVFDKTPETLVIMRAFNAIVNR